MASRGKPPPVERASSAEDSFEALVRGQVQRELAQSGAPTPGGVPDGESAAEADARRWVELMGTWLLAPLGRKLELAREFVSTATDLDPAIALEMMLELVPAGRRSGKGAAVQRLADLIAERHPRAYAEEAFWFNTWKVEDALRRGLELREPLLAAAREAARRVEPFSDLVDKLVHHGRRGDVLAALAVACAELRRAPDVDAALERELRRRGIALAVASCAEGSYGQLDQRQVAELTAPFRLPEDEAWVGLLVEQLGRRAPRAYNSDEFVEGASPEVAELLALELADRMRDYAEWRTSRWVLAHDELLRYLAVAKPRRKSDSAAEPRRSPVAGLFTRARLESYLGDGLGLVGAAAYRAAALAASLPTLLALLHERHLLDAAEAWRLYAGLRDPVIGLAGGLAELSGEMAVAEGILRAWEKAPPSIGAKRRE